MHPIRILAALAVLLALALPAAARSNHALLIGASRYPNLDQRFWLLGPRNDVALVRDYLLHNAPVPFAVDNVLVLADGIEGAPAPTLAAIRAAFATLASRVEAGDFVYLHFAGHGSQAPARDPDSELDGLDELFLPVDIGPWSDTAGAVENALVDDEIGALIDALRARGADVWAVFDSCHSGTATRAAPTGSGEDAVRLRQLDPGALGVPEAALARAGTQTRGLPGPAPRSRDAAPVPLAAGGGLVAFFAAQTNEVTPEMRLPADRPDRRPQGVFTWTLFETLAEFPGATYRQIGQEVLRRYATRNLAQSTPMFEGDLDSVAFSGASGGAVRQWPLGVAEDGLTIPAGALHGLAPGARLALMASPADATAAALGEITAREVDTLSSRLEDPGIAIPPGAWVRLLTVELDFTLRVALPEADAALPEDLRARAEAALRLLGEAGAPGLRLAFVAPGAPADLRLAFRTALGGEPSSRLWLLPPTGLATEAAPSILTEGRGAAEIAEALADTLGRIARAQNLLKLGGVFAPEALAVSVELATRSAADPAMQPLAGAAVPRLIPGDQVHIVARNDTAQAVDINVLYVASDYSITHIRAARLHPGDSYRKGLLRISDTSFGLERILVITTPARPQTPVEDLSFLAQTAVQATRAAPRAGLAGLLDEAGFGTTTRGALLMEDEAEAPQGSILQFAIEAVPGT